MNRLLVSLLAVGFLITFESASGDVVQFGSGGNAFSIEFVTIGNAGNAADTAGAPNPAGAVAYEYQIGKFEISRGMVEKANAAGGLGINLADMSGLGGNGADKPASGTGWYGAAKFANWLNTSSGYQAAYKFNGGNFELWQPGDAGYDAANPYRNSLANYVLPTLDEFYKAAYYDPAKPGGAGYWLYATGSNTAPIDVASGTVSGTAVYNQLSVNGPAVITQAGGLSPYGVMALNGNIAEYQETAFDGVNDVATETRHVGRGVYNFSVSALRANVSGSGNPGSTNTNEGFRVVSLSSAAVPEPAGVGFLTLLAGFIGFRRFGCSMIHPSRVWNARISCAERLRR